MLSALYAATRSRAGGTPIAIIGASIAMGTRARWVVLLALTWTASAMDTLVCLGDGITAGYGLNEEDAYPTRLERLMRRDGLDWRVINAGVSDQTTDQAQRHLDEVVACRPSLVFIALGMDDGALGRPPATVRRALAAICDRLAREHVHVAIAGAMVPLRCGDDYQRSFADVFTAVAAARRVPFMPFLLDGVFGVPQLNQIDGRHPTAAGQARIADHIYAFLRPLLAAKH